MVINSKVDSIEAESLKLRKDLIKAMDQAMKAKENVKELKDTLKVEKKLVIQKDEEVQAALLKIDKERVKVITKFLESDRFSDLKFIQYFKGSELLCRWMMKHHSQVADFANLDFKAIDTKILADKTKEKEGETIVDDVEGDGTTLRGVVDEAHMDEGHVEKVVIAPWKEDNFLLLLSFFLFFFENSSCLVFWGFHSKTIDASYFKVFRNNEYFGCLVF